MSSLPGRAELGGLSSDLGLDVLASWFSSSREGIAVVDAGLAIRAANQAFARQMGRPLPEIVGRPAAEVIAGWAERMEGVFRRVRETGQPIGPETYSAVFQGQPERGIAWWQATVSPILAADGTFRGWLLVHRDVTEQVQGEAERSRLLAEARHRVAEVEAVFRALPDLFFRLAADGTILDYRAGRATDLYVPPEQFLNRRMQEVLPPDVGRRFAEALHTTLHERSVVALEYTLPVAGINQYFEARLAPLGNDQAIALVRNITDRKQAEAERERLLQAERHAREVAEAALSARDEFLAVAAHELKTPITSLRGYAELTMRRVQGGRVTDPQEIVRALETIDRQADRLAILVNQLLDISRLDQGTLELNRQVVDLVALVRHVVETMQASTMRHTLTLRAPSSLPAFVDPVRMEQVLYNLVDNAIRYSPQGGPVEVDVTTPTPGTVRISVRDYGVGIPPEQRPYLFTRFFKAGVKRPAGGLGLGLYIGQRVVALHGGTISAEFPEDGGSRFIITLPRGLAEPQAGGSAR